MISIIDRKKDLSKKVIHDFGQEWARYNYLSDKSEVELNEQFEAYCKPLDLSKFNDKTAIAADFGAGSGRWSARMSKYFSKIYAIEPSDGANKVLQKRFAYDPKIEILKETVESNSLPLESLDLAFSLGVLHHIPDTSLAIKQISEKIKPGGYFLCYLYYKLDDKPQFYRFIFSLVNILRYGISKLPFVLKKYLCNFLAIMIYYPLAKTSKYLIKIGVSVSNIPLHHYADMSFEMMANDALDRFGTKLEQRFNKEEIIQMLREANFNLDTLKFSENEPFWTFAVIKN